MSSASLTARLNRIKDLVDDLDRLGQRGDPAAAQIAIHIKREIDAVVVGLKVGTLTSIK